MGKGCFSGGGHGLCGLGFLADVFSSRRRGSYASTYAFKDEEHEQIGDGAEAGGSGRAGGTWHDLLQRLGSDRRLNSGGRDEDVLLSDDLGYTRPPKWKLLFRKLRSETRKMNCGLKPSEPGFQYDAVSYAMNFDDGTDWKQQQAFLNSSAASGSASNSAGMKAIS